MTYSTIEIVKVLAIGFLTGVFSGGFGVGGGIVCTPLLRLIMGVSPHVAIGTTMALIIPTSISGAVNYLRKDLVDRKLSFALMLPAIAGVLAGAWLTNVVHGRALMLSFACLILLSGTDLVFGVGKKLSGQGSDPSGRTGAGTDAVPDSNSDSRSDPGPISSSDSGQISSSNSSSNADSAAMVTVIGFMAGSLAGFFGVGGGFVLVPCLLYFFKAPIKSAFGTSLLVIASVSIPGTITHYLLGHVNIELMLAMMGGAIAGSFVGSSVALKVKDSWLRKAFGVIMLAVAVTLGCRELGG
ncbi:MAG: sulfite exporter TauE/SafE family protein [Candidatus Melainabacteria bacterium]|nr:sulfite exporter TauE/SafE family protein [Candidatus Melainabacteria bacterium]